MSRVCVVTSVHVANDTRVYFKEVKSIAKQYEVVYIAPAADLLNDQTIKTVNIDKPNSRIKRIIGFYKIWRLCINQKCTLYHLHDPELIIVGILLKLLNRKTIIYDVHEDYPDYILQKEYLPKWSRTFLSLVMKLFEWIAGLAFDAIIVADNFVYKRFPPNKTTILYNYPVLSAFTPQEVKFTKKYDIIYPGSLSQRMVNIILNVVKKVAQHKQDLQVLLVSPFHMEGGKKWVKKRMIEEGISETTILLKDRVPYTEVGKFILESKIGLIPLPDTRKFQKNIPTKLFEYLYCGIPVVASDLPPIRQFVGGKKCCFLVDFNDISESADTILLLLNDDCMQSEMGKNGAKLAKEYYNWKTEEKKLLSLYCQLTGGTIN